MREPLSKRLPHFVAVHEFTPSSSRSHTSIDSYTGRPTLLSTATDAARRLRLPAYIVLGYMTIGSVFDILISAQPAIIHDIRWRLGVSTLLTGASGTELLGAVLFLGLALLAADEVALWVGFALSLLIGVGYLVVSGIFTLDSLQMRGQVKPDMLDRYNLGLAWTAFRLIFTGVVFFVISGAFMRAARNFRRVADRAGIKPAATPLVVGAQAAPGLGTPNPRPNIERPKAPTV